MCEWNEVWHKMPETYKPVLCYGTLGGTACVFAGCWDNARDTSEWYWYPESGSTSDKQPETVVTHWRHYPEPPV